MLTVILPGFIWSCDPSFFNNPPPCFLPNLPITPFRCILPFSHISLPTYPPSILPTLQSPLPHCSISLPSLPSPSLPSPSIVSSLPPTHNCPPILPLSTPPSNHPSLTPAPPSFPPPFPSTHLFCPPTFPPSFRAEFSFTRPTNPPGSTSDPGPRQLVSLLMHHTLTPVVTSLYLGLAVNDNKVSLKAISQWHPRLTSQRTLIINLCINASDAFIQRFKLYRQLPNMLVYSTSH